MIEHALSPDVYDCILPRERIASVDWVTRNIQMPKESKIQGFYRLDLFPHFIEPFNCFDDPDIDRITIQTGAQIGKTAWAMACLAKAGATDPHPMAFADADERSTKRVIGRLWKLFDRTEGISHLCPPTRLQSRDHMRLTTFEVHAAWAGSASSAADYGAYIVVLNECDKMKQRSTDTEADFRWLMGERTKGYVGSKILEISTPSLKGSSYIESQRLAGDNRRRMVPCPHCNHFQELRTGNGKDPGGIRFEKLDGKLNAAKARETAYYECEKCEKKIEEHHRYDMLNAGFWVPEGCTVEKGKLIGTPTRQGRHASFGPLSTLHSLLPGTTINTYAEQFVQALTAPENKREAIRNFTNSWEGKTFDPQPIAVQPDELSDRLGTDSPLRICPDWSRFLTLAADVGRVGDELIFYWMVMAWGLHSRSQIVDYGIAWGTDQLTQLLKSATYPHADGGPPLRPVQLGIDSGSMTNAIYDLCKPIPNCWPIKGSSQDPDRPFTSETFAEMFRPGFQRSGLKPAVIRAKVKAGHYDLLTCNTQRTQEWLEDRLTGLVKPTDPNRLTIPLEAFDGMAVPEVNLASHLLGDYQDSRGHWKKRYEDQDFRDSLRYNVLLAWHATRNGTRWAKLAPRQSKQGNRPKSGNLKPTLRLRRRPPLTPGT